MRSVLIADKRLFSAETMASYSQHGSSLTSRVEHIGRMVIVEVVSQQDVDRRLVKAVALSVLVEEDVDRRLVKAVAMSVLVEEDVDRRLVKAVAMSVLVWTVEAAAELPCRRDAVTLQCAQEPPLEHVLVNLALYTPIHSYHLTGSNCAPVRKRYRFQRCPRVHYL